ncbi:MAG: hypothetical protein R2726_09390 [Acidimicrobiales bacterium]
MPAARPARAPARSAVAVGAVLALLGLLAAVVGVVAGFGAFAARVADLPRIPAGQTRDVVLAVGPQGLYQAGATTGFATTPAAEVVAPDGAAVAVTPRTSDELSGGQDRLRQVAVFTAPVAGTYRVTAVAVEGATTDGLAVGPPYDELATTSTNVLVWAVFVGGLLFVIGVVVVVVGLSRREQRVGGRAP